MQSQQTRQSAHRPRDKKGCQIKRSSGFLLGQLIFSLVGAPLITPFAQAQTGTTCSGQDNCLDLYQSTLGAIQAYGYQPNGLNSTGAPLSISSFDGGVLNGGTMVFSQSEGVPGTDTINSVFVYNCPDAPASVSGTVTASVTVTNSSTLSSDTSVSNQSSSFNQGSNSVSLSYQTPPSPYGTVKASDTLTYTWGSSTTNSSTSSSDSTITTSTNSTTSIPVQYNLPPGQATTVQITLETTVYSGDSWSAPITLNNSPTALSNLQYIQKWNNVIPPNATTTVDDNGTSVNANVWFGPTSWSCYPNGTGACQIQYLVDPSGQYTYWPTQYGTIGGWLLNGPGAVEQIYWSTTPSTSDGADGDNTGMYMTYANTPKDGSYLYGELPVNGYVSWNPKVSDYGSLALLENGNLVALNSANSIVWSSNAGKGIKNPTYQTVPTSDIPSPEQLLGSKTISTPIVTRSGKRYETTSINYPAFAFYATGTYSSNSYSSNGSAGATTNAPMTESQISTYCSNSSSKSGSQNLSSSNLPDRNAGLGFAANSSSVTPEEAAGYTLTKASFGSLQQGSYQVAQNDVRREHPVREYERDRVAPRSEGSGVESVNVDSRTNLPTQDKAIKRAVEGDGKRKKLVKVKHIKGPIVLRTNQFYASSSPGVKVLKVVVDSDNMTNFSGFAPGTSQPIIDPNARDTRKVEFNVGHELVTNVKPRSGI